MTELSPDVNHADAPYCEIIGCHSRAQWRIQATRSGRSVEQNLCHPHWRQAMADRTLNVIRWSRATPETEDEAVKG